MKKEIKKTNDRLSYLEGLEKKTQNKLEMQVENIKKERARKEEEKAEKEQEVIILFKI